MFIIIDGTKIIHKSSKINIQYTKYFINGDNTLYTAFNITSSRFKQVTDNQVKRCDFTWIDPRDNNNDGEYRLIVYFEFVGKNCIVYLEQIQKYVSDLQNYELVQNSQDIKNVLDNVGINYNDHDSIYYDQLPGFLLVKYKNNDEIKEVYSSQYSVPYYDHMCARIYLN